MLIEGELLGSVAPGEWRRVLNTDGDACVAVTFGTREAVALQAQLASWAAGIGAALERDEGSSRTPLALLEPMIVDGADAPATSLLFDAPERLGAEVLPSTPSPRDVFAVLRRVADALDTLHARRIMHGGLGLRSLWWMQDGTLRFPDAGLAHMLEGIVPPAKISGAYLAPEVWRRGGAVPASDQYSLAVIAFELFTGRVRFTADADNGVTSLEPLTLERGQRLYPGAPPGLNEVMQRALSASPGARFDSCADFVNALEGQSTVEQSLPTVHRFSGMRGSLWNARSVGLAAVAVVAVGASVYALRAGLLGETTPTPVSIDLPAMAATATENVGDLRPLDALSSTGAAARTRNERDGSSAGRPISNRLPDVPGTARDVAPNGGNRGTGGASPPPRNRALEGATVAARDLSDRLLPDQGKPSEDGARASGPGTGSPGPARVSPRSSGATGAAAARASASPPPPTSGSGIVLPPRTSTAPVGTNTASAGRVTASSPPPKGSAASNPAAAPVSSPASTAPTSTRSSSGSIKDWATNLLRGGSATNAPAGAPATGTLRLRGPSGARYYVDGVLVRPSGGKVSVVEGLHDVDIVIPNGSRTRKRVRVTGGETVDVKL